MTAVTATSGQTLPSTPIPIPTYLPFNPYSERCTSPGEMGFLGFLAYD